MALTRKLLKGLSLTDEQIEMIIEAHAEIVDGLKQQIETAKANAEQAEATVRERDDLKKQVEKLTQNSGDAAKVQAEFDAYKQQVESEKVNGRKTAAVRAALKAAGVQHDELIDLLAGKVDIEKVELDGDNIKDATFADTLKSEYPTLFGTQEVRKPSSFTPPSGNNEPEDSFLKGFGK